MNLIIYFFMKINLGQSRIKFFTNIVLPSILAVVLFIVTLFFIVIPHFENAMMDRKREMITELTNAATSILEKYYKDEVDSVMTRSEAQRLAISRIQYLRYGEENKDYFWITDMTPIMIVHPYRPELNGQNLENYLDTHGKQIFIEFVNVVKESDQGYVEYMWQWKDNPTHIVPKLSYVKGFKPWGWIVGTGIYIEDVKNEIAELSATFTNISIFISLIIALILFWISRQSFKIERKRLIAEEQLNQSNEKYRSLVEASTEGLIMYMDNKISFVNPVFERMAGLPANEILQRNLCDIIEVPDIIRDKILSGNFDFRQISTESKIIGQDNNTPDIVLNILPITFYGKEAVIFSVKDTSIDNIIKKELSFSKEKFQNLMDKLNQGIFRTSIDKKGKFMDVNKTGLKIIGYKHLNELENKYILDLFVEEEDKRNFRSRLLETGFLKNQIVKLKKKNGEHILASVSVTVIYDNGIPKFCDGIIKDITLEKTEESNTNNINHSFISFSQLFYQPLRNFSKPFVSCLANTSINQLIKLMNQESSDIAIIKTETGENIGYITDAILRLRGFSDTKQADIKAYQIMTSPIPTVSENNLVLEALNKFKKENLDILLLENDDRELSSYIRKLDLIVIQDFSPANLIYNINSSVNFEQLRIIREKYITNLIPIIENNTHSSIVFKSLSLLSDLICKRIIEIIMDEIGTSPVPFSFICLGSEGRQEETLKTDQDNAIIYDDIVNGDIEGVKNYFHNLSLKVCTALDFVGYTFCTGNVMAMNPDWCQPLSEWKSYFTKWINNASAQDLLDISIFFDFRSVFGEEDLATQLKNHIIEQTNKNSTYLFYLAQTTIVLKPQVGFWGNILLETAGAPPETVNIKKAILPIVNFARIYALKLGISNLNTVERLYEMHQNDLITYSTYQNVSQAFEYLALIRMKHQVSLVQKKAIPDNLINTKNLSDLDKSILKKLLSYINSMLSKLNFDFKGIH